MRKAEMDKLVQYVMQQLSSDFMDVCEQKINESLRECIVNTIYEILLDSEEFKGIIKECFSEEAKRAADNAIDNMTVPITVKQMSMLTGMSEACIYQQHHRGKLNFVKKGNRLFISIKELNSQILCNSTRKG